MNHALYAFIHLIGTFLTLGLLAADAIPPLAAGAYLGCFILPVVLD